MQNHKAWGSRRDTHSLRASSPVWASETGLARTHERAVKPLALVRLASLAQIGELACRLRYSRKNSDIQEVNQISLNHNNNTSKGKEGGRKVYKEKF